MFDNMTNTVTANFGTILAFESATLTLTVSVNNETTPGTTITNTATATSSSSDPDPSNNSGTATTTVVMPQADLGVGKTGDESAPVGGQINYTVVVGNNGTLDAMNVTLIDPIPAHTTFVNASVSQGTFMFDGTTVTASFGTVGIGNFATLSLTVSIDFDTAPNTTITNTAMATSSTSERNPEDNSASASTIATGLTTGDLIISEFRLRGPGTAIPTAPAKGEKGVLGVGRSNLSRSSNLKPLLTGALAESSPQADDEFVELYNNTDSPITVNASDESSGFALAASDGVVRFIVPNGTVIPARGHFLGVNSLGYSLGNYPSGNNGGTATGDASYSLDIPDNAGIALFRTANPAHFSLSTRVDAVGSTTEANTLYKEGTGYPALNPLSVEYSFFRDMCGKGGSTSNLAPCSQFTPRTLTTMPQISCLSTRTGPIWERVSVWARRGLRISPAPFSTTRTYPAFCSTQPKATRHSPIACAISPRIRRILRHMERSTCAVASSTTRANPLRDYVSGSST